MSKLKMNIRWTSVSYWYITLFFAVATLFVSLKGSPLVAAALLAECIGVALRSTWAIRAARVIFGLAAAMGIMLFFNPFLLADFSRGHDLMGIIPRAAVLFVVYEAVCLSGFYLSNKIRQAVAG